MTTRTISNADDVIDSRDVIARIKELRDEREDFVTALEEAKQEADEPKEDEDTEEDRKAKVSATELDLEEWDESADGDELRALKSLAEEAAGYAADWEYGETLIRESYFTQYCIEMVQDIGDLPKDIPDYLVIDWEKTADNIRADYTEVDYDGVTYLVR